MIINCWQASSWDSALEVWFSLLKRKVSGSTSDYLQLTIFELIGHNNSISSVKLHFLRNYLKNIPQNRLQKNTNWSTMSINCWQPSLLEGERSSGMVLALGARGPGFTTRLPLTRDNWNILSQQFHILLNTAFFLENKWKTAWTTDDKKLINWSTMIINCWQPSSWDSALEVWFSLWKREVSGSTSGYLQLTIIELIGHNNSISSVKLHFLRNYLKNSPQNRLQKIQIGALWVSIVDNHIYWKVSDLVAWFSLWVREVQGSLLDCP